MSKSRSTKLQQEQQQIAWVLFITAGAQGNLGHASHYLLSALPGSRKRSLQRSIQRAQEALSALENSCHFLHHTIGK